MELKITRKADDMLFITTNGKSKTDKNVWMIDKDNFYINDFGTMFCCEEYHENEDDDLGGSDND